MNAHPRLETLLDLLEEGIERSFEATACRFLADDAFMASRDAPEIEVSHLALQTQARAVAARLQAVADPSDRALLLYPSGLEVLPAPRSCSSSAARSPRRRAGRSNGTRAGRPLWRGAQHVAAGNAPKGARRR